MATDIRSAMAELTSLFPGASVCVEVALWSHVYKTKRDLEATPSWRVHVAACEGRGAMGWGGSVDGKSLDCVLQEARDYVAREKLPKASVDAAREALKTL